MKHLALLLILLLWPVIAAGQARTAEKFVDVPFSQLNSGSPPNGSVRHVINGVEGTTPCQGNGTGAMAYKINGVWECPKMTPGIGTGNVLGGSVSAVGEIVLYASTNGLNIGRSNTLTGVLRVDNGIASTLSTSGTGSIVLAAGATQSSPVLMTPFISDFSNAQHSHANAVGGGQLNASNVFNAGIVPSPFVVSGVITNQRCLRVGNTGLIEVAAFDCGAGGGGSPGGVSGNLIYNESGSFGGISNSSYTSATGVLTISQKVNGNDSLFGLRATDSSPTGSFLRFRNSANTTDLFAVSVAGSISTAGTITLKTNSAPSTPASGNTVLWADTTDKNLKAQDDAGTVSNTVRPTACSGTDKVSGISASGAVTCTADQGGSGTGVITLNGLNTSDQSFADVDDTNVTLAISSATSTHTFTIGWAGRLDEVRMDINSVMDNKANTWSTGAQSFAAASSLTVPTLAGASPTTSAQVAFDSTSSTWEVGVNGTNRTLAFTAGSQTFSDKTLDNSNIATLRDSNFTLVDNVDITKTVNFQLGGLTTGTNRVVTIADANSVTVQPSTFTASQVVTHIDSNGGQQKAQLAFSDLTGALLGTQGGTDQTTVAQGDLLFGSATNTWSRLPKSTLATRVLTNTGASNNPAWGQVDLTNAVTGVLPPANWSPLTTKGDLLVHNGTTTTRLAVGTNGFVLTADSAQTAGVKWAAVTATAAGSSGQLQYNSGGSLAATSAATTTSTTVTFSPGALIIGNQSADPTVVLGGVFVDSDDNKLYYSNGTVWGEVYVSGLSQVNLASANVTGILPPANTEHTVNAQTGVSYTVVDGDRGKLITQSNGSATAYTLPSAAGAGFDSGWYVDIQNRGAGTVTITPTTSTIDGAASLALTQNQGVRIFSDGTNYFTQRGIGGGGSGTPGGIDTQVQFNDGGSFGGDAGMTYAKSTDILTLAGSLVVSASGAGYLELAEGTAPSAVANRVTVAAPTDVTASGWVLSLPTTAGTTGQFLQTNGSGVTTWASPAGSGTVTATGGSLTANAVVLGAGTTDTKVVAGIVTDGASKVILGVAGSSVGAIDFNNATSGTITLSPVTGALGAVTLSLPARTATVATTVGTLTSGRCVEIDGSGNFIQAAAACSSGGGTINSGVTNIIPKYTASTTLDDSLLSDDGTTLAYSGTGGFSLTATGGGYLQFTEGSPPSIVANTVQHAVAADAPAAGVQYLWGSVAAASGILRVANSSGVMTVTQDAGISHLAASTSADLRGVLGDESGTGAAVFAGGNIGAGTATTAAADDSSTLIATTAYVQTELTAYASDTKTLSNTTYDTAGTGNAFTSTHKIWLPGAGCQNTSAASFWDLPTTTPAVAACVTGTNTQKGYLDFADTSGGFSAQTTIQLPDDFTGTVDADIQWLTTATTGNVEWALSVSCTNTDATQTDDQAFETASTVVTAAPGIASRVTNSSITSLTITNCGANDIMHVKLFRDGNDAQDTLSATARFYGLRLTLRRAQ